MRVILFTEKAEEELFMKNKKITGTLLALLVMALWGSLFPFIKIGYDAFNVDTSSPADILVFAGIRFILCGAVVIALSIIKKETLVKPKAKSIISISAMGFFGIVLHYAFTYLGLSMADSSKTALLKQLGALLYVCFAFLFIKEEKFSFYKIIGAILGFCGIIAINAGGGSLSLSMGDWLIIFASVSLVVSNIMSKRSVSGNSPFWVMAISQFSGGIILFLVGIIMGGKIPNITPWAALVFTYICAASIVAYVLWFFLQKSADLSNLFIIKFAEPLFAALFGAVLLGEDIFKIQYLLSFVLISSGIMLANKKKTNEKDRS